RKGDGRCYSERDRRKAECPPKRIRGTKAQDTATSTRGGFLPATSAGTARRKLRTEQSRRDPRDSDRLTQTRVGEIHQRQQPAKRQPRGIRGKTGGARGRDDEPHDPSRKAEEGRRGNSRAVRANGKVHRSHPRRDDGDVPEARRAAE